MVGLHVEDNTSQGKRMVDRAEVISKATRIVIKIGGSLLFRGSRLNSPFIRNFIGSLIELIKQKREIVLVSSGAIALGKSRVSKIPKFYGGRSIPYKQACASIGQIKLMNLYCHYLEKYGFRVGQVLISAADLNQRETYINAQNTIFTLLGMGAIPIVNENDTVAVEEIQFGDNDTLSAKVVALIKADLLVIFSDVKGFYTADPKKDPTAKILHTVERVDEKMLEVAKDTHAEGRVGGMQTKIIAAKIANRLGIPVVIGGGRDFLHALFHGKEVGTFFYPLKESLRSRKRWIAYGMNVRGGVVVDEGAKKVLLLSGRSLLPVGIKEVQGKFRRGNCISVLDSEGREFARGIVEYSSTELEGVKGLHGKDVEAKMGSAYRDEAIHRDNLVIL